MLRARSPSPPTSSPSPRRRFTLPHWPIPRLPLHRRDEDQLRNTSQQPPGAVRADDHGRGDGRLDVCARRGRDGGRRAARRVPAAERTRPLASARRRWRDWAPARGRGCRRCGSCSRGASVPTRAGHAGEAMGRMAAPPPLSMLGAGALEDDLRRPRRAARARAGRALLRLGGSARAVGGLRRRCRPARRAMRRFRRRRSTRSPDRSAATPSGQPQADVADRL